MEIISARNTEDEDDAVTQEHLNADWPELQAKHKKALKDNPTWAFFGGVIVIGTREYQVL